MEYRTITINAFVFDTEEQATAALATINAGEGLPVDEEHSTQTYTVIKPHNDKWYIIADEVTTKYLTGAQSIEVTT